MGHHRRGVGLPDRGRRQRAHRLGPRRESLHAGERRRHEAAVETEAREHAARDAQPVRAARRRTRSPHRRARASSAVVAGVSDDLFGIDVATGKQIWHRHFDSTLANPGGTNDTLCPGGQTAVPTMAQASPGKYTIYAVSWDGRLRQINLADGQDVAPPEKFMPGGGKPYALNLHDGVIYTATAQGCGGLTNAFYSFDLATRRASAFIPAGGGLWGRRGAVDRARRHASISAPATRSSIR